MTRVNVVAGMEKSMEKEKYIRQLVASRRISNVVAQELSGLIIKRSHVENLMPLTGLCMHAVADNVDYFLQEENPFKCLPSALLLPLFHLFEEKGLLGDEYILPKFITRNSLVFKAKNVEFSEKKWIRLFYRLGIKSKSLQELYIYAEIPLIINTISDYETSDDDDSSSDFDSDMDCDYDHITPEEYFYGTNSELALHQMLSRLHKLEVISFGIQSPVLAFALSDDTLAIIGASCPLLRILHLGCSEKVTDKGINYLCAMEAPHGMCKNIRELNIQGTSITKEGIKTAIHNLPLLENLECDSTKEKIEAID